MCGSGLFTEQPGHFWPLRRKMEEKLAYPTQILQQIDNTPTRIIHSRIVFPALVYMRPYAQKFMQ